MSAPTTELTDWRQRAACRDLDPDDFFPEGPETAPGVAAQVEQAKQVCSGCPVRLRCLLWAMGTKTDHGVWGGMTETERASARRTEMRRTARARKEAAA